MPMLGDDAWENIKSARSRYLKAKRKRFRQLGLCTKCGKPALPGHSQCQECLDYYNAGRKRMTERRLEAGLCILCGQRPHREGKKTCCTCGLIQADRAMKNYDKRKGRSDE